MKGDQFELSDKELEILTEHSDERVESGVYEWTPGKALKNCRILDPQLCPDKETAQSRKL